MWSCFSFENVQFLENGSFRGSKHEKFFKKNGALLLEKLISCCEGYGKPIRTFSAIGLKTMTNNYASNLIVRKTRTSSTYKGIHDNRNVTIKKYRFGRRCSRAVVAKLYINEAAILSRINHKNVLTLLGCCLETEIPILIYEFSSNGCLSQYLYRELHSETTPTLPWESRLRIAIEIADAICYLHTATFEPIIHRNIKSSNIFLDENYVAKLFGFGYSTLIPVGETYVESSRVKSSSGFAAPEYIATRKYTEKSDVYSYGVVLLEIFAERRVSTVIVKYLSSPTFEVNSRVCNEDGLHQFLKANILNELRTWQEVACAMLALNCLKFNWEERPTMKEVAQELRRIEKN